MNATKEFLSVAQGRKCFYDWLDANRPWAHGGNAYDMMEKMVDAAALAFCNDYRPTVDQVREMEKALMRFTGPLDVHPENYDGPCMCADCRRDA